jgi:hypothetical protein
VLSQNTLPHPFFAAASGSDQKALSAAGSKAATLSGSFPPRAKIVSPEADEPHHVRLFPSLNLLSGVSSGDGLASVA